MSESLKKNLVTAIPYLYILLFVYAAVSKLKDYDTFRLEVAQSPLLTAFAGPFAIATLIAEFTISLLLAVQRWRLAGLYCGFALMSLFSAYIFIILNFSPYVPCSCGGILEEMGWTEHLIFNLVILLLGGLAIMIYPQPQPLKSVRRLSWLMALSIGGAACMALLFLLSEHTLHRRNNFVRRIPPFAIERFAEINLSYNSFYIAGADKDRIYLGNHSAPSVITVIDSALQKRRTFRIALDDTLDFKTSRVSVKGDQFYVYDGSIPCIYQGSTKDWKAKLRIHGVQKFTHVVPIDSTKAVFRAATLRYGNLPGIFDLEKKSATYMHGLLQKQIDGIFDTDGTLQYSEQQQLFVFLYYYRNQYIVTDENLNLLRRGNTIDTTTTAKIKIGRNAETGQRKFTAPPLAVNRLSTLHRNLLFVNSALPGKYDSPRMWGKAAVVDIYDVTDNTYLMSFYINNEKDKRVKEFHASGNRLFCLFEDKLVGYKIDNIIREKYKY